MDWGPHIFSIINFILDNDNYKLIKSKVYYNDKNKKINLYFLFNYKNFIIKTLFGNNFKRKITKISIQQNDKKIIYNDSNLLIKDHKHSKKKNYQTKTPLENSIKYFLNSYKKNIHISNNINDKITNRLEKIKIKLFN